MNFHFFPLGASQNVAFSIGFIMLEDMPGTGWQKSWKSWIFMIFMFFAEIAKADLMCFGVYIYHIWRFLECDLSKIWFSDSFLVFRTFLFHFSKRAVGNGISIISGLRTGKIRKLPGFLGILAPKSPRAFGVYIYIYHIWRLFEVFSPKKSDFLRFLRSRTSKVLKFDWFYKRLASGAGKWFLGFPCAPALQMLVKPIHFQWF